MNVYSWLGDIKPVLIVGAMEVFQYHQQKYRYGLGYGLVYRYLINVFSQVRDAIGSDVCWFVFN